MSARDGSRCCVIGGAGFIGAQVTRLLAASGREVIVIGRTEIGNRSLPVNVRYEHGDYSDRARLRELLRGAREVVDLAYATAPQTSFADPIFDVMSNLPPSVALLQEALAAEVRKVLLVSSGGTVYGVARTLPIAESHPTDPISPYGITKLAIEKYGLMFKALFDLPVIVVRPGNAYGEGQRRLSGQGFIATAMQRVVQGEEVEIYGPSGTIRDYVHVEDIASGIVAALNRGLAGQIYNVGTGIGRSNVDVLDVLEPLAAAHGYRLRRKFLPARAFDVPANYLDSSRLHAASGWNPLVPFDEGIARLWRAVRSTAGR